MRLNGVLRGNFIGNFNEAQETASLHQDVLKTNKQRQTNSDKDRNRRNLLQTDGEMTTQLLRESRESVPRQ